MKTIFYFVLPLVIFSCKAQTNIHSMESIDKQLQTLVDKGKTPSVSYLLFNKDSVIHSFKSGLADVQSNEQTTEATTYSSFSVTKTFTAMAVLQLAEQKKLSIDDKIKKYVDDFPYSGDITIRQLLNHTAGIPNPLPLKWVHLPEQRDSFNRNNFFTEVFAENSKVKSEPNEKFAYSNLGYVSLGQLIEEITGQTYESYIHENIIAKIGISEDEMNFYKESNNRQATGYQKKFSFMNFILSFLIDKSKFVKQTEGPWISFNELIVNGAPHGGLMGTPHSFMKYIQELLNPDCTLLSEEYKKMLFVENRTNSDKVTGMCLSWFKGQLNEHVYYTHAGGGAGYYCEIRIYPEKGIGSVIMFNRTGVKDERFLDEIDTYYFDN